MTFCSYRGVFYCNICGAFSLKRCRLLNSECTLHMSVFSSRAHAKLKACELPAPNMRWPLLPRLGVMQPTIVNAQDDSSDRHDLSEGGVSEGHDTSECLQNSCIATNSHFDNPEYQMSPPDPDDDSTFDGLVR